MSTENVVFACFEDKKVISEEDYYYYGFNEKLEFFDYEDDILF